MESDDQTTGATAPRKPYDVGFLFVHGIGTQQRGQTLAECTTPLVRWLTLRCAAASSVRAASDVPGYPENPEGVDSSDVREAQRALERATWDDVGGTVRARDGQPALETPLAFRADVRDVESGSSSGAGSPAHATLALLAADRHGRVATERWLMAESWWAASFAAPGFSELARWGLGVLPWIVGSHCAAQVRRRFQEPLPALEGKHLVAFATAVWSRASALGGLVLGMVLSAVLLPVLVLFLLVGAIPVPSLRKALLTVQLKVAAILGDCYVLLARPVESASIVSQVRRDLSWLAAQCSEVVIVAHSQGGAVAHLALRTAVPGELKLLFTFGSGLRKLEEARALGSDGSSFALSGVVTSIAMLLLVAMVVLWAGATLEGAPQSPASVVVALGWIAVTGAVCLAGVRDHLRGFRLPELTRWIAHVRRQPWRWRDCYASGDPVSNGAVLRPAKRVTREVCNRRSMLEDHTTYWENLDEFVSTLFEEVSDARSLDAAKGPNPFLRLRVDAETRQEIAAHRRWRATIGRTIQWTAVVGLLGVATVTAPAMIEMARWLWVRGSELLPRELGMAVTPPPRHVVDWTAVGWLLLLVLPYRLVRGFWLSWDRSESTEALRESGGRVGSGGEGVVMTAWWFLAILSVGIWTGASPSIWTWFATLAVVVVLFVLEPKRPGSRRGRDRRGDAAASAPPRLGMRSSVESLITFGVSLFAAAALPFGVGLSVWEGFTALVQWFAGGSLWGFEPTRVSSGLVGVAAVVVTGIVVVVVTTLAKRPTSGPPRVGA